MTRNQTIITDFARQNDGNISKKQAVELLDRYYYSNGAFYIGNSLSKMVKSGILERLKRGHFKLLQVPISKPIIANEKQLNMF
jgi:hypothetical protein